MVTPVNTRDAYLQASASRVEKNYIAIEEKISLISDYQNILNIQVNLDAQATTYGITTEKTTYDNAISSLTSYLNTLTTPVLWNDNSNITTVVRSTLNTNLTAVYTAEKVLRSLVNAKQSVKGSLTVPNISMTADSSNVVSAPTLAASGGTFKILSGTTDITTSTGIVYSIVGVPVNCSVTINSVTGVYVPTAITADNASAVFRATLSSVYGNMVIDQTFNLSKVKAGINGKAMSLMTDSQAFKIDKSGVNTPSSINLTVNGSNLAVGSTAIFTIASGTATLSGTGDTRVLLFANMATNSVTISVNKDGLTDLVTIIKLFDGTDTINGQLTNESHTLNSDLLGNVTSYTGASCTMNIFKGITNDSASWTFTKADSAGLTSTISSNTVTLTNITNGTDSGYIDITATRTGYATIVKRFSISKAKQGTSGKGLSISADSQIFQISKNGLVNGVSAGSASITLTGIGNNLTGTPAMAFTIISGTASLTGIGGTTRTLSYSTMSTDTVTVEVTGDGLSDRITIVKVREGTDAIVGYLTNESVNLPSSDTGVVSSYTAASGNFIVMFGSQNVTSSCSFNIITNTDALTSSIGAATGVYSVTAGFPNANNTTSITYSATYVSLAGQTYTIDKVFSLSKAKQGQIGNTGPIGPTGSRASVVGLYVWGYTAPSLPTGTTQYTWSTGTWIHPKAGTAESNGWQATVPIDNSVGKTLYYVEKPVVDSTGLATSTDTTWSGSSIVNLSRNGDSSYTCYSKFVGNGATPSGTVTTSLGSYPGATVGTNGFTGATFLVPFSNTQPTLSSGEALYISDGYSTTAGQVVWGTPYVSSFRVGSLSALSADLGTINAGAINIGIGSTSWHMDSSGNMWAGAAAFGSAPFSVTSSGTLVATGATISGNITATSGSFTGTLTAGSIVYASSSVGTSPTSGSGAIFNSNGKFSIGDTTNNITYNGTTVTLNGTFVKNNIIANTADLASINSNLGAITGGSLAIGSGSAIFKVDSSGNIWSGNALFASAPFKVTNTGILTATGVNVTGVINATSGSFTGDLNTGTAAFSGVYPNNTMTGTGFKSIGSTGAFILGNAATNFAFDGTNNIVVNGALVKAGNISVTNLSSIKNDMGAIVAGSITLNSTGFIKSTGVSGYNSGTGFWMGYDTTTYKLYIGSSTKSLKWDGTDLTLSGDLITSGKVLSSGGTTTITIGGTTYNASIIGVTTTSNVGVLGATDTAVAIRAVADQGGIGLQVTRKGNTTGYGIYATNAGTGASTVIWAEGLNSSNTALEARIPTGGSGYAAKFIGKISIGASSPLELNSDLGAAGRVVTNNGTSNAPKWGMIIDGGSNTADASGNLVVNFANSFTSSISYGATGTSTSGNIVVITAASATSVTFQVQDRATGAAVPGAAIRWTAIGN